jgi:hypothetical protein
VHDDEIKYNPTYCHFYKHARARTHTHNTHTPNTHKQEDGKAIGRRESQTGGVRKGGGERREGEDGPAAVAVAAERSKVCSKLTSSKVRSKYVLHTAYGAASTTAAGV